MAWLTQNFLNPAFVLPGAALLSVPILIHLLSRLRYRRVRFAAMEFLLQSDEMNRRRLIIEQLLLLLLRVLAVLLIVLLLARLVLDPSGMLLLRGATAHHVLILDDSLSMRDWDGRESVFDGAVTVLERMLSEGSYRPRAIRVTVLTMSAPDRPLVTDRALDNALLQELIPRIRNIRCSYRAVSPVPALAAAENILSADGGVSPRVHVLTDFRKHDWNDRPEVVAALEELGTIDAKVNLIQTAREARSNVAVTRLNSDTQATAVGVLWRLNVTFRNLQAKNATGLRATVLVNGVELPARITVPDLEPNADVMASHDLSFDAPGRHQVEVRLEDDSLPEDNRRYIAVNVANRRAVLLVDDEGRQEDARFVSAALSANPNLTGINVDLRTSAVLTSANLDDYDCLYLLNVRELPADAVQRLADYVKAGGGIAWFPDDQANTDWYNTALQEPGRELFPVQLGTVAEIRIPDDPSAKPPFETPVFEEHPVFRIYNLPDSPFPAATLFRRWYRPPSDWVARPEVAVLARLTSGDPIVFEHRLGEGRVLTFLTTAGRRWSNWPVAPALPGYVVMQLLVHAHLQKPDASVQEYEIGSPVKLEWRVSRFGDAVEVFLPERSDEEATADTDARSFVRLQAAPLPREESTADQEERLAVTVPETDRPGIYRVKRFNQEGEPNDTWLAMNVSTAESDLELADPGRIEQESDLEHVSVLAGDAADGLSAADSGRELRWILLGGLIALLIAEQLLSLRMSFHPEVKA